MGDIADYYFDVDDLRDFGDNRESPTCRQCRMTPLHWVEVKKGKWRLHEPSGKPHYCRPDPKTMFDDENA